MPTNSKRHLRHIKLFLPTKNFNEIQGVISDRIQNFYEKKSHITEKTQRAGGPFGLRSTFGSIRKFCGLVLTLSCFSDPRKIVDQGVEKMNKKCGPIALN